MEGRIQVDFKLNGPDDMYVHVNIYVYGDTDGVDDAAPFRHVHMCVCVCVCVCVPPELRVYEALSY